MFSYLSPDGGVRREHPLRPIRRLVNKALVQLSPQFDALYAASGRSSIAPERVLRALLLHAFHGVRSERQLMKQATDTILFRWFLGLLMEAPVWA